MIEKLLTAMQEAADVMREWPQRSVEIIHHNDADGLSSGAILTKSLERKGYAINRFCLEKPYPAVLDRVLAQKGKLIVFADFAGRIAPMISARNKGKNLVIILDHHKAAPSTDPMVYNLDPELFGFKGDRDITASTTCYLFAKTLDPVNQDLASIAVIGAVGDHFFVSGRLASQNREVALEAQRQGVLKIQRTGHAEEYFFPTSRGLLACEDLGFSLDTLGAAGYYQKGPEMGIRVCLNGTSPESDQMLRHLRTTQNRIFNEQIRQLRLEGLKHTKHIQWFHVQRRFHPMGVKMIGAFCNQYKDSRIFDPDKYIAGFQIIPNHIPEFGRITLDGVKISMRVSSAMQAKIRTGEFAALDEFLPEATDRLGGFSDACHGLAAATTVAIGKEEALIAEMEKVLGAQ